MTAQGDVVVRADHESERYVVVLSGPLHIAAGTGRLITCPFIPGTLDEGAMVMTVSCVSPRGLVLPELVQWLPRSALGESIGTVDAAAVREAVGIVAALMS
ncbi:toxin [Tsukamurella soli]|uniref:mRNA interferase MazF n=1 Tax=Tsukamurella soli TaxID=644556 RepID=A0ABP8KFK6_9ACTN